MDVNNQNQPDINRGDNQSGSSQGSGNKDLSSLIDMPQIGLPTGGGALKSIDEKFEVNTANGTASFTIPLPLSQGRTGFTPNLTLRYNSGSGNGPFGLGWQLDIPSIIRKTDKRIPQYQNDNEDVFLLSGVEDLVPYLNETSPGTWEEENYSDNGYKVKRYRPRIESVYSKIEMITHSDRGIYWKVTSRNNIVTIFGRSPSARIADPEDDNRIFQWLAEFNYDDKGNWIKYYYKEENLENVPNILHEKSRLNGTSKITNQYIKKIIYGNNQAYYTSAENPYDPIDPTLIEGSEEEKHFFELVFDYGEHDKIMPKPIEEDDLKWEYRTDAFSSFRSSFEIRTYRICKRILMFHNFSELGGEHYLVKSLELVYEASNINNSDSGETTYLASAVHSGYIKKEDGSYSKKSLPPISFEYQKLNWNTKIQSVKRESLANVPVGITNNYRWVDLYGESISGILTEQNGSWYYKRNLGNLDDEGAQFSPSQLVTETPSFPGIDKGILALQDLEMNGEKQIVVNSPLIKGFYEFEAEDSSNLNWESFTPFQNLPNIDWRDANTRFIDLNGDGLPELVVSEENAFMWYENLGKAGYDEGIKSFKSLNEDLSPSIVFSDTVQSIFLADMTGDGLTDIVRIRNGEICYWANKGYGTFGAKVNMSSAPLFDLPDLYNPNYLYLADVSGTGATDIIYLGKHKFKAYINLSGNGWSDAHEIDPFVKVDNLGRLSVIDLLGTGTSCIVWSTDMPSEFPMRYIDLMSSKKPHVMTGYQNNLGKKVNITYKSSTYFYLKDKKEGNPWITKLPFPVQVIENSTIVDQISSSKISRSYKYHHGYYDHEEREFRGFGMVEQIDKESFEIYIETDELDMAPILTKTWIHTGSYSLQKKFSAQYQDEFYGDDSIEYELPDSFVENASDMNYEDLRQAVRSLKGKTLRQEIYTLDGSEKEAIPYLITENNFTVKQVQPQDINKFGAYQSLVRETLTYTCERNTSDPRIAHQFVLESDEYGHTLKSIQIAYPRRSAITESYSEQLKLYALLQTNQYENEIENYYRLGLPLNQKQFEINGLSLVTDSFFSLDDLKTQLDGVLEEANILKHHESFSSGVQARLFSLENNYYKEDDLKALALPAYSEQIIMSYEWATDSFDSRVDDTMLEEAGYEKKDGYWWLISEKPSYQNSDGFYLPYQTEDPFGNVTSVTFDQYNLLPYKSTDALGNITEAKIDYRILEMNKVTDINDNVSEAVFDELGLVIATTMYGTEQGRDVGDDPISEYSKINAPSLEDVVNNPNDYLQGATSYFYYYLESWESGNLPPHFVQLQRETHVSDLVNGEETEIQISLGYSDGFGRNLQSKVKIGDSQWLVSGRTIYNNKQKAVKKYEPFITNNFVFQSEEDIITFGVTPILYYDALGRLIKSVSPDDFHSRVEIETWQIISYDFNDTLLDSDNYSNNSSLIGTDDPRGIALDKSQQHYNTPTAVVLDSLGREFMILQLKEASGEHLITHTKFDIQGNPLTITDPRQYELNKTRETEEKIQNFIYKYDLAGNVLSAKSSDAGESYTLINVVGNQLHNWNALDYHRVIIYDRLHRPTQVKVEGNGLDHVVQKMEYGTDKSRNQNEKLIIFYDQAGMRKNVMFDFKGQLLESTQQLCFDYKSEPDWDIVEDVEMAADIYTSKIQFNALGRVIKEIKPDGSVHIPTYNPIGWLKSVGTKLRENKFGIESAASETSFVENIDYNAKGQRTKIDYGNGIYTTYTYDEKTFRLTNLLTKRKEANGTDTTLQDISYVYDPNGNVLMITDKSHERVFNSGQIVDAKMEFVYDALYQLKEATGREHLALSKTDYLNSSDIFKNAQFVNINDSNRLRNYRRYYAYDDAGNLTQLRHTGENSFTRNFIVAEYSNRTITGEMDTDADVDSYFDAAGNMMELDHIAGIKWNYRGNLASANIIERESENDTEYYVYDGKGNRTRKVKETYSSTGNLLWTEEKIYLGGVEIKRKYQGGSRTLRENRSAVHIMDNQKRIAIVYYWEESNDNSVTLGTNKIRFQLGNHLGSASLELDSDGQLISYEEYYPFGGTAFSTGSSVAEVKLKEYRYTGKERDDTTALYYYGARYYAPWMCRWLSPDPGGTVDGLNLYLYVDNNPIRYNDPSGNGRSDTQLGGEYEADRDEEKTTANTSENSSEFKLSFAFTRGGFGFSGAFVNPGGYTLLVPSTFDFQKMTHYNWGVREQTIGMNAGPGHSTRGRRLMPTEVAAVELYRTTVPRPTYTAPGGRGWQIDHIIEYQHNLLTDPATTQSGLRWQDGALNMQEGRTSYSGEGPRGGKVGGNRYNPFGVPAGGVARVNQAGWYINSPEYRLNVGRVGNVMLLYGVYQSGSHIYGAYQFDLENDTGLYNTGYAVSSEIGGWSGAYTGAYLLAPLGAYCGPYAPVCIPVAGFIGGGIGYWGGSEIGGALYESAMNPSTDSDDKYEYYPDGSTVNWETGETWIKPMP